MKEGNTVTTDDKEQARRAHMLRAHAALEAIANILHATGFGAEERVKLLLSAAAVEHHQGAADGEKDLRPFDEFCREAQELAVLAEHPNATASKGSA